MVLVNLWRSLRGSENCWKLGIFVSLLPCIYVDAPFNQLSLLPNFHPFFIRVAEVDEGLIEAEG